MRIYGAGMAGLIAAHVFSRHNPVIHEAQSSLPNNHAALLRFRSDVVSQIAGIPFKKVTVYKSIYFKEQFYSRCHAQLANMYSQKVTDAVGARSIWNLSPVDRFIAPPDFIEQLALGLNIVYESPLTKSNLEERAEYPIVSTIPMPVLMELTDWPKTKFKQKEIYSLTCDLDIPCDVYQTIYFPDPEMGIYRASLTGNHLIAEFIRPISVYEGVAEATSKLILEDFFGIKVSEEQIQSGRYKVQKYGKILNTNIEETRAFIMAMTEKHGIYSLGRFGTWRQLLLDDIVSDCYAIERLITTKDTYEAKLR